LLPRNRTGRNRPKEALKFDITIVDEHGKELVDIEEFTMLQVSAEIQERSRKKKKVWASPLLPQETKPRKRKQMTF